MTVNDDGGKTTTITGTATVADAALTGSAAASVTATEGAPATLTNATFTDANPGNHSADFSGTINWGDGTHLDIRQQCRELQQRHWHLYGCRQPHLCG